jgi:hypothetical protein
MKSQQLIVDSRLTHIRELKTENARLRAENASMRTELDELNSHLDLAILAAEDLRALAPTGRLFIWDGWNMILGTDKKAHNPKELISAAKRHLADNPDDMVWIVFDGPKENSFVEGNLRVSYTGGTGLHRADKLICDYLRMARFRGLLSRIEVKTSDKDFLRDVKRIFNTGYCAPASIMV